MFRVSSIVNLNRCFVTGTSQRALLSGASKVSADVVNKQKTSANNFAYHRGLEDDILNQILEEDKHYARLVSLEDDRHARILSLLSKNKYSQQKEEQSTFIQHSNTQQDNAINFPNKRNNQETDLGAATKKVDVVPFLPSIPKIGRIAITPQVFRVLVKKNDGISPSLANQFVQSLVASSHDADAVCEYVDTLIDIEHLRYYSDHLRDAGLGNALSTIISAHINNMDVVRIMMGILIEHEYVVQDLYDSVDKPDYNGGIFDAISLIVLQCNDCNKSVNIRMACDLIDSLIENSCSAKKLRERMKERGFVEMLKKLLESPHSHTFSNYVDITIELLEEE